MPGHVPARAYFTEADRTGEQIIYSPHASHRRGAICCVIIAAVVGMGPAISLRDSVAGIAGGGNWTAISALYIGLQVVGLVFCLFACIAFIRSAITTKWLHIDPRNHTLRYERFVIGRPRGERTLSADEISSVSISAPDRRGTQRLMLHYHRGGSDKLDASHDPAPLEQLGVDIATTLGVPFRRPSDPVPV